MNIVNRGRAIGSAAFFACAAGSQAVVLFNNFGPGDTFGHSGWAISGSGISTGKQLIAAQFTTTGFACVLDSVTLALASLYGTNEVYVSVLANNGVLPDTSKVLATWDLTNLPLFEDISAPEVVSGKPVALKASTHYWVMVSPGANDTEAAWKLNSQGLTSWMAGTGTGEWTAFSSDQAPTMRVTAIVPEPLTLATLGAGLIGLALRRRRAR